MSTKAKTEKATTKKNGGDDHDEAAVTSKGRVHTIAKARAAAPATDTTTQSDDTSEIVVFAFRLTRSERDEIHAATGSAKASQFVRGLALAAARQDGDAIQQILTGIHASR